MPMLALETQREHLSSSKDCASVAHGPFGCHLKDKCVQQGEEHPGSCHVHVQACRLVLTGVAPGYSDWGTRDVTL